jgi:tRNA-splicing ligase RtcB (3'-phosphate/5'-hydroxy nucleic acid ligase)
MSAYEVIETDGAPIKAWTKGVPVEEGARRQLENVARLPFIHHHIAAMPDVHWGLGATVGAVIPCRGAIVPAAVGVDIGCGMMAVRTSLTSQQLPESLAPLRASVERAVPHGRTGKGRVAHDRGAWRDPPPEVVHAWKMGEHDGASLEQGLKAIIEKHPKLASGTALQHLGTLGTGNHFIELCLDETDRLWAMLHSGSRGIGNRIGTWFIEQAKAEAERRGIPLPDRDLAWLPEGTDLFADYVEAVGWAQAFAHANRELMMARVLDVLRAESSSISPPARSPSTATTTTSLPRSTSARGFGSRARARCTPAAASSASSPARWGPDRSSSGAAAIRTPSSPARTVPDGRCRATRRSGASRSPTTSGRRPVSSVARIRA